LNERIIELIDIAPKEFWALKILILIQLRNITQNLKLPEEPTLKAFGEKEIDEFENRFQRLMLHFTRYNIDSNVIERVILGENQDDIKNVD
jgi:phosphate starvation-inducible PhoH-like protein